ncbi:hypothetical protein LOTGIDRAFT_160068 [Lottia gigantea]|uniref:Sushi domain-containing protein n=1 Tax=Lottia gigantea TaxID=225164 RepID=V4AGQ9_LOTGI|nr:hypothetical protein LOTGIDRAFT_160068 [Lottia gigantea]ESO96082.1 hypothetical protein LOTGIDRAFT_160068 [Lottia gigantea]
MTLIWIPCLFLLCFLSLTSAYRCDASQFGNLVQGKRLSKDILESIKPGGLALCARECLYRTRCQSFNYVDSSDTCELIGAVQTGNLDTVAGTLYSEKSTWPTKIAGLCRAHDCSDLRKCVQQTTMFSCIEIYETILQANDTEMKKGIVDTISGISKADCINECLYRSLCKAFNYKSMSTCELGTLVMVTDMNNYVGNNQNSFYSAINQYDSTIAGICASSPCSRVNVCEESGASYICTRKYCLKPTNTVFDQVVPLYDQDKELWLLSTNLTYKCQDGYYPVTMWNCQLNGTWTSPSCLPISRCNAIFQAEKCDTPNRINALYILKYPDLDHDILLYCKVDDVLNWVEFVNVGTTYSYFSTNLSEPACHVQGECGTSTYTMVRAIPTPAAEYVNNRDHAIRTCPVLYGPYPGKAGKNCTSLCNIPGDKGRFQIDLRGTGLKFMRQTYTFEYGTLEYAYDDQVASAVCDDCNNICQLGNKRTLPSIGTYINYTGAIRPVCKTLG